MGGSPTAFASLSFGRQGASPRRRYLGLILKDANLSLVAGPEVFDQNNSDMTTQLTKMRDTKVDFIIAYSDRAGA